MLTLLDARGGKILWSGMTTNVGNHTFSGDTLWVNPSPVFI